MDEFALIEKLFRPLGAKGALDLKDDAAILSPPPGHDLILTKDAIVEGVHFRSQDAAGHIAQKLARVNLSDLAAKGARPLGYLLATAFHRDIKQDWLEDFAAGLARDQAEFGWSLYGGDTVTTDGPMMFSLTAIGVLPEGTTVRRAGASVGDDVYVTGTIGDGGLGLQVLADTLKLEDEALRDHLIDRYLLPRPRTMFGQAMTGFASAGVDISDGLIADAAHLALASGVCLELELDEIPLSGAANAVVSSGAVNKIALAGMGDDYELLFTCAPSRKAEVASLARGCALPVSRIGRVIPGDGCRLLSASGEELDIKTSGYNHFLD